MSFPYEDDVSQLAYAIQNERVEEVRQRFADGVIRGSQYAALP
jgi:hypothetical protein